MTKQTNISVLTLALTGVLATTAAASGDDKAGQAAVDFRESAMTIYKWYLGPMGAMVKGKTPVTDEAVAKAAAQGKAKLPKQRVP